MATYREIEEGKIKCSNCQKPLKLGSGKPFRVLCLNPYCSNRDAFL